MTGAQEIDEKAAHRFFAADCFNKAWELIDKPQRTPAEDEQMLRLSLASHYHWTQRDDYDATAASVAYWQTARIYALLRQADNARRYGQLCLEVSLQEGVGPFFKAYAYEALARAEAVAGNHAAAEAHLVEARRWAEAVPAEEDRRLVMADLDSI